MRYWYYYLISIIVLIVDFVTKKIVATRMELYEEISVIGNFFLITSHRNTGAAFGILQNQRTFFIIVTVVIVTALIWYLHMMRKVGKTPLLLGLALVLGGAIGNFVDRVRFGEVVDFFKFNFGSYTFPIFNIADSAIVCGVGLILLDTIISMREEKKQLAQVDKEQKEHEQQSNA
ncbi:signal peptidase II [Paenibacillus sp. L3-i20]|uniref:signal peptidase II n=1 Tax=Paenibacillus sp. L3-i20 TaxID=2905833 RepID=UPI001EDD0D90|nr:signal peptidase II [Paenibacillus sp. L3-i20]GKU78386.1 lipoprotein signal peptidase [Paenibacillus sp. L3-i20]